MEITTDLSNRMIALGMLPQHLGFGYICYAINLIASNPVGYYSRKVDIFEMIMQNFDITKSKAARCMRYSIEIAWNAQTNEELRKMFPNCSDGFPPSVTEFVCRIAIAFADENGMGLSNSEGLQRR